MIGRLKMGINIVFGNEFFQILMMVLMISFIMILSEICYSVV